MATEPSPPSPQILEFTPAIRALSLYVIGKPGTGKSTLLRSFAYDDMVEGAGLCFIDPHEDAVNDLLAHIPRHRLDDLIVWDPTQRRFPYGLNPFACNDDEDIDARADNFLAVLGSLGEFQQTFASAPRMKSVLKHLAITFLVNQGYTLAETTEFLTDQAFRQHFYPRLAKTYPQVLRFWQRFDRRPEHRQLELTDSSINKLERFQIDRTMRGIFGQSRTAIDFRAAMDEGKIILVKLARHKLGDDNASFLGAFIVWEILQAALSRSDIPEAERRQFHLYADEFQTFMTSAFPRLIMECRKFGVDVVVAHQARGQLDETTRKTTMAISNKIVFGVSGEDARELASEFSIEIPEPPVTGYKPRYTLAVNALEEIEQHGHEQHLAVELVRKLRDRLNRLYGFFTQLLATMDEQKHRDDLYRLDPYRARTADEYRSSATFKEIDQGVYRLLDDILYAAMDGAGRQPNATTRHKLADYFDRHLYPLLTPPQQMANLVALRAMFERHDAWGQAEMEALLTRTDQNGVYIEDGPAKGYVGEAQIPRYIWRMAMLGCNAEYQVAGYIEALSLLLASSPVLVQTGQLDPIYDRPRLHSDVQLELANELATLPPLRGRCIIVDGTTRVEHRIQVGQPTYQDETVDARHHDRSLRQYGRPFVEVEQEIEHRLSMQHTDDTIQLSDTDEDDFPPPQDTATDTDSIDDDEDDDVWNPD